MRLSTYAKNMGVSYKTAWRWWKEGKLNAYQLDTGTIIVREPQETPSGVALYARASSNNQKAEVERQLQRLRDYAAAKGYVVTKEIREVAPGVGEQDQQPKLLKLLANQEIGIIIVERRDRLTRFGFSCVSTLLEQQGRRIEVMNMTDSQEDLIEDFSTVLASMAARIYGRRSAKQYTEQLQLCIRRCFESGDVRRNNEDEDL